jgi:murein tripeptide amidase MpaA
MRNCLIAALLLGLATSALAQPADRPFVGHQVHRVTVTTQDELDAVTKLSEAIWSCHIGLGSIDIQITPDQTKALDKLGIPHHLMINDVQALLDAEHQQIDNAHRQRDIAWFNTYRTTAEISTQLDALAAASPQLASTFIAGQTLEARNIKGIRFSSPDLPGNPRSGRPSVLFNACQHAREWISPMTAMWVADTMLSNYNTDPHIHALLDKVEVIVIPIVNVDGYTYTWGGSNQRLWRKNRRNNGDGTFGVDTNRNWGYQWGGAGTSTTTSSDIYRGTSPFSEPETQVMRDFITANPSIRAHIDFHSYAQLILSPWGYTLEEPTRDFASLFDSGGGAMASAIYAVNQKSYVFGPSYSTIYPASGVAPDWCFGARGIMSWTIELRDTGQYGFVLPADQIVPTAQENFQAVLGLCDFVAQPLWFSAPGGQCQALAPLWLGSPSGMPEFVKARQPATVHLSVKNGSALLAGPPTLFSLIDSSPDTAYAPATMTSEGGTTYSGTLPAAGPGRAIRYYFEAQTTSGQTIHYPQGPGAIPSFSVTAYDLVTSFNDDMEADHGWTTPAAGDTAVRGQWARGVPELTAAQPNFDVSPTGTLCWMTNPVAGASLNANDVDGGITTLTSPAFNAVPPSHYVLLDTRLNYWRWYSNDQGNSPNSDTFRISTSRDNGANWTDIEVTGEDIGRWVHKQFSVPGAPTATTRVRFIAGDLGNDSCVEAGVDEVSVVLIGGVRSADFDGDGDVGTDADIEAFFSCLSGQCCPLCASADFNFDGDVGTDADIEDFFLVLGGG